MKLEEKRDSQRIFNKIIAMKHLPEFADKIASEQEGEYITFKSKLSPETDRFVMLSYDNKTKKLEIHTWEKTWRLSLGMYHSHTIFRTEVDLSAEFFPGDLAYFLIEPVLKKFLG